MRLPIVYANTAVRVLEIAGANVASLIVIITSSVVIELDLIFLTALKNRSKGAKKKTGPLPPPPPPLYGFAGLFFFSLFLEISSPSFFSSHCHSITKISFPLFAFLLSLLSTSKFRSSGKQINSLIVRENVSIRNLKNLNFKCLIRFKNSNSKI